MSKGKQVIYCMLINFEKLKTKFLGKNIINYQEIDSTQDEIWRLINNQMIENGTIVIADLQTKGRGTHGRIWYTDESNNIAFSFFIQMNCNIRNLNGITREIAEKIVEVFYKKYGIKLDIKEPNDIMYKR